MLEVSRAAPAPAVRSAASTRPGPGCSPGHCGWRRSASRPAGAPCSPRWRPVRGAGAAPAGPRRTPGRCRAAPRRSSPRRRRRFAAARPGRQGQDQHAEHAVGAVDQRQALLLGEHAPASSPAAAAPRRRQQFAVGVAHLAFARSRASAHVRQRRQVAGAAERPVLVHDRGDARVEAGRRRPARSPGARRCGRSPAWTAAAASSPARPPVRPRRPTPRRASESGCAAAAVRISGGMWRVASAPKPVETPYTGLVSAASSSMRIRLLAIAASDSSDTLTAAPSRATRTTSSALTGPMPTLTVSVPTVMTPLVERHSCCPPLTTSRTSGTPGR